MGDLNLYDDMAAWYCESVQYDFDCLVEDEEKFAKMFDGYDPEYDDFWMFTDELREEITGEKEYSPYKVTLSEGREIVMRCAGSVEFWDMLDAAELVESYVSCLTVGSWARADIEARKAAYFYLEDGFHETVYDKFKGIEE